MKALLAASCLAALPVMAASDPAQFHLEVIELHGKLSARQPVRTEVEGGDYEGAAAARHRYVDTRTFDAASGRLLSRVRRDADHPERVHIVEVNVYEQGRLVRDFGSITLPWAPSRPVRTFINLHRYNGGLHGFRQFDFFGQVGYEFCEGELGGKPVRISLDESDIDAASTSTAAYKACFDGMETDWARYRAPH